MTLLIGCLSLASSVRADDMDDFYNLLDKEDYPAAWAKVQPLIQAGNEVAMFEAALMCQKGQGMSPDLPKAIELYKQSAGKGFNPAMNNLGVAYREGRGVQRDFVEAMKWFKQSAMKGNSQAALNVGAMYVNGQGVPRDYIEGWAWYQLSTDDLAKRNATQLEGILNAGELARAKERSHSIQQEFIRGNLPVVERPGTVAMSLQMNDKKELLVSAINVGSQAEKAGIKPGDVLIEINGKKLEGLPPQEIGKMIEGPAGSIINLSLKRGDQNVAIAMPRDLVGGTAQPPRPTNPLDPTAQNPLDRPVELKTYSHPDGLWTIRLPTDWLMDSSAQGSRSQAFRHRSGALIMLATVPQAPYMNGEQFYRQAVRPGLVESGAKFADERAAKIGEADGFVGRFNRTRNGVEEMGQSFVTVVRGTGFIFQMVMPNSERRELGPVFEKAEDSFRITVPRN